MRFSLRQIHSPSRSDRQALATATGLSDKQIQSWFVYTRKCRGIKKTAKVEKVVDQPTAVPVSSSDEAPQTSTAVPVSSSDEAPQTSTAVPVSSSEEVPQTSTAVPVSSSDEAPLAVRVWLEKLMMVRYFDAFVEDGFDTLECVRFMTQDDLMEIASMKKGHMRMIKAAIAELG